VTSYFFQPFSIEVIGPHLKTRAIREVTTDSIERLTLMLAKICYYQQVLTQIENPNQFLLDFSSP
jgi:hypothetical protein